MSNIQWSSFVQGPQSLDYSREMRFRDDRKDLFLRSMGLTAGMTVVDVGCGPGTLTRKLAQWLGNDSRIIGVDRDASFIDYARRKALDQGYPNIDYMNGDALHLPLEPESVDACTSHTVIEHVPNRAFLMEQKRICKAGGIVSVMSAFPDKSIAAIADLLVTDREKELWSPIHKIWYEKDRENGVAQYAMKPGEYPLLFDELGFVEVEVDAIALPAAIENPGLTKEQKLSLVEKDRQQALESVSVGLHHLEEDYHPYADELTALINERFDCRKQMVRNNHRLWDYNVYLLLVVKGRKP
jgi:ubiquinone/menaquinone biosynthesis C-methylase UbiE